MTQAHKLTISTASTACSFNKLKFRTTFYFYLQFSDIYFSVSSLCCRYRSYFFILRLSALLWHTGGANRTGPCCLQEVWELYDSLFPTQCTLSGKHENWGQFFVCFTAHDIITAQGQSVMGHGTDWHIFHFEHSISCVMFHLISQDSRCLGKKC